MTRESLFALALVAGLALSATPVLAETVVMSARLSGAAEVPANDSAASGEVAVSFDTATGEMSWTVTYEGLSGPAIGAHIHGPAAPGSNGGIVIEFDPIAVSPITGSAVLTSAQASDLLAGLYYVNLHTAEHPGGEVRGQLTVSEDAM